MAIDMDITLLAAVIGVVSGVTGAILGVINTLNQLQRNKVRLRVSMFHAIPLGALERSSINFGIEVINLSEFAVVITDVGFQLSGDQIATFLTLDGIENEGKLPCHLAPRTAYSKLFHIDRNTLDLSSIKYAYAKTRCGHRVKGNSPALRQLMKRGKDGE